MSMNEITMKKMIEGMMTLKSIKLICINESLAGILRMKEQSPILRPVWRKKSKMD